jgi:hypothetical protein
MPLVKFITSYIFGSSFKWDFFLDFYFREITISVWQCYLFYIVIFLSSLISSDSFMLEFLEFIISKIRSSANSNNVISSFSISILFIFSCLISLLKGAYLSCSRH